VVFCVRSADGSEFTAFGAFAPPINWPFRRNWTCGQLLNALTRTLPVRFQVCASLTTGLIEYGVQAAS
jgi:hypothetical protein